MTVEKAIAIIQELWRYKETDKYTETEIRQALDMSIEALRKLSDIQQIIESPVYIQEDVIRYKMICEIIGE